MDLGRNANGICFVALRKCWLGLEDVDRIVVSGQTIQQES